MMQGNQAQLTLKKSLLGKPLENTKKYSCLVLRYEPKQECIYLVLTEDFLTELSLDGIYECLVQEKEQSILCTGRIKERYCNRYGKIMKFVIENGFYKINLKSVDK